MAYLDTQVPPAIDRALENRISTFKPSPHDRELFSIITAYISTLNFRKLCLLLIRGLASRALCSSDRGKNVIEVSIRSYAVRPPQIISGFIALCLGRSEPTSYERSPHISAPYERYGRVAFAGN